MSMCPRSSCHRKLCPCLSLFACTRPQYGCLTLEATEPYFMRGPWLHTQGTPAMHCFGQSLKAHVLDQHMVVAARKNGVRAIVFNGRGTSDSPVTTPQFYSSSFTGDMRWGCNCDALKATDGPAYMRCIWHLSAYGLSCPSKAIKSLSLQCTLWMRGGQQLIWEDSDHLLGTCLVACPNSVMQQLQDWRDLCSRDRSRFVWQDGCSQSAVSE